MNSSNLCYLLIPYYEYVYFYNLGLIFHRATLGFCFSDYSDTTCMSPPPPVSLSVKPRKGSAGHKHRLEAGAHGKCRLCSALQTSPVCGSDGHTYSSKVRFPLFAFISLSFTFVFLCLPLLSSYLKCFVFIIYQNISVCFHP